jgi:hypothetical protein
MITAVGAIKAVGEMFGRLPLYSMIMRKLASDRSCVTIFDGRAEIKFGVVQLVSFVPFAGYWRMKRFYAALY